MSVTVDASMPVGLGLVGFAAGFTLTLLLVPKVASYMRRKGVVGVDVHKPDRPEVPEMVGVVIVLGAVASATVVSVLWQTHAEGFFAFIATVLIAAVIGAVDDLRGLGPKTKPLLMTLSSVPILLLGTYDPHPVLPFVGATRLTIVYPLLVPAAISVTSNAMNMADPVNGVMSGTSTIILAALLVSSILLGRSEALLLSSLMLGTVLAFFWYNRYPSRVFSGDIGSLSVGAAIGAIVVMGQLEVVGIVAMMPQIMNAFYILSSVGGLLEHSTMPERPVKVLPDGRLDANLKPEAPMTLTRIILARGPLREKEVADQFLRLTIFTAFLAILTALVIRGYQR
ncbi:MAG: hypothetical protein QW057_05320 [Candidatus Bathyarchaeia archaeon]